MQLTKKISNESGMHRKLSHVGEEMTECVDMNTNAESFISVLFLR